MARRDEYGLYDLDTESSSVDTLSDHDPQGAPDDNLPETEQQFENPGHVRRHSDSTLHRINHVIDNYARDGDIREDREPDNRRYQPGLLRPTGTRSRDRPTGYLGSDLGPSASQTQSRGSGTMSQVSQAQSTGQSDVAKSYELQIRKNKAQLIQLDEMLRQERNTVIAGSLRVQKDCLLEEIANLETNIKTLHRVSANAKKYKAQITLPDYRQAPLGYRRQGELESKNVLRVVHPPFNPDLHPKQRLKYVWDKLLHYGRDNYFSEADYLSALGMVLSGEPFEIYNRCIRANYNLLQTIEELTTFYESGSTMNDIKREHNSFQRLASEAITKTMYRYRALVEKMKDEFTPEAWPEVREVKLIAMLKNVVTRSTRQHIEMEEARCQQMGYKVPIEEYVRWAEEHEDIYDQQPKKSVAPMIQMATMAPSLHAEEVQRNMSQLKNMKSNKTWVDKNKQILDSIEELKRSIKDLQVRGINNTSVSMDPAQLPLPQASQPGAYKPQQPQGWNKGQQWHTASGQQGQTMPQSQWHEHKKRKAENEPASPQPETLPTQAEQSPRPRYNNQYRGGYRRGGFTGRTLRGKPLYKIQGELVALCMPCNAVHIGSDQCEFDPEFGPIPNELGALEHEETFHEDGDSVDLKPDSEED